MNPLRLVKPDLRARPKPFAFYPPKSNRLVLAVSKLMAERELRRKLRVTEIDISQESLDRLRQLKGERCLVTPSHCGGYEPHVVLCLSKLIDLDFNFLAAVELFEQSVIQRWVIQRLGVYSIVRGTADRASFSMTRQLLSEGKRWLVIFPEGETIWQGGTLMPFQQGVFQLAFKAFEDARKTDADASLYCIPVAIKYTYPSDMSQEMDETLSWLEAKLAIGGNEGGLDRYARMRRVAEAVLAANEKAHRVTCNGESTMNDRIHALRERVVGRLEQEYGLATSEDLPLLDRVRALFNAVDRVSTDEPAASPYEKQLVAERQQVARNRYNDLWRLLRFVAIYDGYVKESMTVDRFIDVLGLLEAEVLGKRRVHGPRKACVAVGEPVNLKDRLHSYSQNKRGEVAEVTMEMESRVREMLHRLGTDSKCVSNP